MIDNIEQVQRLLAQLKAALPLTAGVTSRLAETMHADALGYEVPQRCQVTDISYAGYAGGIMCKLILAGAGGERVFHVSITHLTFHRRHPLAREIAAYQKHRIKRMRIIDADRPSEGKPTIVMRKYA